MAVGNCESVHHPWISYQWPPHFKLHFYCFMIHRAEYTGFHFDKFVITDVYAGIKLVARGDLFTLCVFVCVCVCVRERERERECV